MATIEDNLEYHMKKNAPHNPILYEMLFERGSREYPSILERIKIHAVAFMNVYVKYQTIKDTITILLNESSLLISSEFCEHFKKGLFTMCSMKMCENNLERINYNLTLQCREYQNVPEHVRRDKMYCILLLTAIRYFYEKINK